MEKKPRVTWVMPAYNVARFIGEAIGSILAQTCEDWELVVVDDCSTDETAAIVARMAEADPRIRLLRRSVGSGSAYLPRRMAIEAASADIVAPLDADDKIGPHYLEHLLAVMDATGADIVYPQMCGFDGEPVVTYADGIADKPTSGRELVRHTLDGWHIACDGGVIRRDLYLGIFGRLGEADFTSPFGDELLTRYLLYEAPTVVVTDEPYYYRVNADSISRAPSPARFELLANDHLLIDFVRSRYGDGSEEYILVQRQTFHHIFYAMRLLNRYRFDRGARRRAWELIRRSRGLMDREVIKAHASPRYRFILESPIVPTRLALRGYDLLTDRSRFKGLRRWWWRTKTDAVNRREWARETAEIKRGARVADPLAIELDGRLYHDRPERVAKRGVICMLDGEIHHGGLTDRLRGILTAYREARRSDVPFHILWDTPFELTDYLVPATFDWRITRGEVSRSRLNAAVVTADDMPDGPSHERLSAAMQLGYPQIHLYTNADSARGEYAALYRELFRPTERLQREVDRHRTALGTRYWSIVTRFQTLLGDFNDHLVSDLTEEQRTELLDRVTSELLRVVRDTTEGVRIHITSDSIRFLEHIRGLDPRFYIVPGEIRNTDLDRSPTSDPWLKTFTDQQLIMGAERVVRMRTGQMYPSGFPRFAAEVGGARFIDHRF
ncbi:MAG: glycosyltransferase [Duncaniella sp.]|nr:glycosyltransferase [Duncaniella sp.]